MKKTEKDKGITLIALVITIIILLILAGISIATLTGENGLLVKANKAEKQTDIVDTKEQIKLEIMGNFDKKTTSYTNQDVIAAVAKITGNTVEENTESVQSKKGNSIDISDLWIEGNNTITFTLYGSWTGKTGEYTVPLNSIWNDDVLSIIDFYDIVGNNGFSTGFRRNSFRGHLSRCF